MSLHRSDIPAAVAAALADGVVIPAHPLALTQDRQFDPRRQRALTRYYVDAGAGGLAVGVHTTQFAIREAGLYEEVLRSAADTAAAWTDRPLVMIAGVCGRTEQALREAAVARDLGYHAGLLSLAAFGAASDDELIEHACAIAAEIPLVGFYLQRAVGGRDLSPDFWRRFAEIDNVVAIKMAPFDRYRTIDVVRGVAEARAEDRVTLYTGNDDHIVLDLLTPHRVVRGNGEVTLRIKGGLLGQWSVWTSKAVEILARAHEAAEAGSMPLDLLTLDAELTDANGALFDVKNAFAGCIAGCHEVLRRQGLLDNLTLLDPDEGLGPGQAGEIDRVCAHYPHLADDTFVAENRERWLS
ncbi:dihydrodipicolinate synthase family protein [Acuticoccus mangrovi]|uniref:Dihydrodipicolinate synthase family protein n=1 Tax=Acuticoccus mangrovi TaxID=2796142 RepID=A0A934IQM9_9HYPH|nr:dihydrodipicolinate synthase family protein [Acuticoccus mangrovi]MBJ3775824.1 dihydrodipicolinate synthase family protein [Acuticoccus mangrovi]